MRYSASWKKSRGGQTPGLYSDPRIALGKAITNALDPVFAPGKVMTLAEMPPEKRAEMEKLYGRGPKR